MSMRPCFRSFARKPEEVKIICPIMLATTTAVAAAGPIRRGSPVALAGLPSANSASLG
jgi:hypothetical protein